MRFDLLTPELVALLLLAFRWQKEHGETLTITGADRENYPTGGVHKAGYGWDLRVQDIHSPAALASFLLIELKRLDVNYTVLYGGPKHLDHIHVAWLGKKRLIYNP